MPRFIVPEFKIRSEKGNRRPSKRYLRTKRIKLSESEVNDALDFIGRENLAAYRGVS